MLKIRLQRVGRTNHAEFRVVVTESTRGPKSSNYLEKLGHYDPHSDAISLNAERIKHWIASGAQVSDTVHNLLISNKVITGKKRNVLPKKTAPKKEEVKSDAPAVAKEETSAEAGSEEKEEDKAQEETVEK